MRVLVIGASGFMGRGVGEGLRANHEVIEGSRNLRSGVYIDLQDPLSIATALKDVRPDAIVNCAGIVEDNNNAKQNPVLTKNLLEQIRASKLPIKRIVILGAAAEYGIVDKLPVTEETPLKAISVYGRSKIEEVETALRFRDEHHLPIVIARVFNPIGFGMHPRMLVSNVLSQISAFRSGLTDRIEVTRLDAKRDYIDIEEVGRAIGLLLGKEPRHAVYNIGSGVGTSNQEIIELMLAESKLRSKPPLVETSDTPEPQVASVADITRMRKEFGWKPAAMLSRTIERLWTLTVKRDKDRAINVLVVGAGSAGSAIAEDIARNKKSPFKVVGFIDDDPAKQGETLQSLPVLGNIDAIKYIVPEKQVEELFIAIPSERGKVIRNIVESTTGLKLTYKILPRQSEVLIQDSKEDFLKFVRKVRPEDLLGGEILKSDQEHITDFTHGKVIMVTGAAGSIGSELSRQIAAHNPQKVILYDWWENGMFYLRNQLLENHPETLFEFIIGDIKDRKRLNAVMERFQPHTVFHAAAYKHVPLMEYNPAEAIKNNIVGTKTVGEIAIKNGVKKFIMVSTDKAVNPTNIMGATKRAAEQVVHVLAESQQTTTFCSVRFGNVINSNGSVIPTFQKQIAMGGPVGVTHPEITRFFMTIPEAVHLILQAWVMGENNDLFVLDMGEPVKIYDLAHTLIALEGYEPDVDIKIDIIGLRPGEKLYEEVLVNEEETKATNVKKIFRTQNYMNFDKLAFLNQLATIIESVEDDNLKPNALRERMKELVSTYQPRNTDLVDESSE